jgi:acyl-CoA synthetase (AMP-forming)/AMP-acid ligase II
MTATSFGFSLAEYPGETFLRTGDLGFLEDKQIFVSGRIKDVLIVRGVKHHAVDLAATVSAVDARFLTGGGTVVTLDEAEQQKIVVLQEMLKAAFPPQDADVLKRDIGAALIESHGFKPDEVFLLREGQLLRTTSGKLQRPGCATLAADLILQARQPNEG